MPGASPQRFEADLLLIRRMIEKIKSRGGHVVLVMMPTSGNTRRIEERFLRSQYWDLLATRTGAVAVHFADFPSLQFECPDGGHLDCRSARMFTIAFTRILQETLKTDALLEGLR